MTTGGERLVAREVCCILEESPHNILCLISIREFAPACIYNRGKDADVAEAPEPIADADVA